MDEDCSRMYTGRRNKHEITKEWIDKTTDFLDRAFARDSGLRGVMCPCSRCMNTRSQTRPKMIEHLFKNGFRSGYTLWIHHGESRRTRSEVLRQRSDNGDYNPTRMGDMVDDMCDAFVPPLEEEPKPSTMAFFDMLSTANQPLHGHTKVSQLDGMKSQQRDVSYLETFVSARRGNAEGTLCNLRAQDILDAYSDAARRIHGQDYDVMHSPIDPVAVYKAGSGKKHGRHAMADGFIDSRISLSQSQASIGGSSDDTRPQKQPRVSTDRFSMLEAQVAKLNDIVMSMLSEQTGNTPRAPLANLPTPGTSGSTVNPVVADGQIGGNLCSPAEVHVDESNGDRLN